MIETQTYIDGIIEYIAQRLPEYPTRKDVQTAMEGMLNRRTLANLDSLKQGPGGEMLLGRRHYKKDDFLVWLRGYLGNKNNMSMIAKGQ